MSVPVREAIFVSWEVFLHYHRRRKQIAAQWSGSRAHNDEDPSEALRIVALMRNAEYEDLRSEMRGLKAQGFGGRYLVAV